MALLKNVGLLVALMGASLAQLPAAVLMGSNTAVLEWGSRSSGGMPVPVTAGPTTLYPSPITLGSPPIGETITDVEVTLLGGSHTFADDLEIALAFNGVIIELMNDAGGGDDVTGDLTFAAGNPMIDDVSGTFPGTGTFDVSVYSVGADNPAATASGLNAFDGLDPTGSWSLYVFDDAGGDTGSFAGGWSLEVTTAPAVIPEPSALGFLPLLLGLTMAATRQRKRPQRR